MAAPEPPRPLARPIRRLAHGVAREDPFAWMGDIESEETLDHLAAENRYAEAMLAPLAPRIAEVKAELLARLSDAEESVPYRDGDYFYVERIAEGADYPQILRWPALGGPEEMVLDIPALAVGEAQFHVNDWEVSPDHRLVAYALDRSGDRRHELIVREIATGTIVDDALTDVSDELIFAADSRTLLYVRPDPQTLRDAEVWRHVIGEAPARDLLVFGEGDERFSLSLGRTKSKKFLQIAVFHSQTATVYVIPADRPDAMPRPLAPRVDGVRHFADHWNGRFVIQTNLAAPDFRLMEAGEAATGPEQWREIVPERPGIHLSDFEVLDRYLAIEEEHDAVVSLRVIDRTTGAEETLPRPDMIGVMGFTAFGDAVNVEGGTSLLRFGFTAPTTPETIFEADLKTGASRVLKRDPAARWVQAERYRVQRLYASAPDGEEVPVTLVAPAACAGPRPTLLMGYGAYGMSEEPLFRPTWLSLVDRGFVVAIAHGRGGLERGQRWYDSGRMLQKPNSFSDFIAVGKALKAEGISDPLRLYGWGGSAGGLLIGAVLNQAPGLLGGAVLEMPFLDVVTTMSDPDQPLTTFEYEEWGNPAIEEQFLAMLSYSPYDNLQHAEYPPLLVLAGLNDTQVSVAEPAKWVARLRATKTDPNPILFQVQMEAGHAGASGRFGFLDERATVIGWLLAQAGVV